MERNLHAKCNLFVLFLLSSNLTDEEIERIVVSWKGPRQTVPYHWQKRNEYRHHLLDGKLYKDEEVRLERRYSLLERLGMLR